MTTQAARVAQFLQAKRVDDVFAWIRGLHGLLASETALEAATVQDLVARARPRWGVSSPEEARAYVDLWDWLVQRFPIPALIAAHADVLYLLGGPPRRSDVLCEFARAVTAEPELFVKYSGDFADLAENSDPDARLLFELAKIRFYVHEVDRGEMDEHELQDAVHDVLARYPARADVRAELHGIAMTSRSRRQ